MKKTAILLASVLFLSISCKTIKTAKTPDSAYEPAVATNPGTKVFSVPEINASKDPIKKEVEEAPIAVRKETVTFAMPEDKAANESNTYFIIVGSFSALENAKTRRGELIQEGFKPIILHSEEAGYYRLCVNSFTKESEARQSVHNIRQNFPKYYDSWLLIKQ